MVGPVTGGRWFQLRDSNVVSVAPMTFSLCTVMGSPLTAENKKTFRKSNEHSGKSLHFSIIPYTRRLQ
ncbi:hypothetical protein JOB18_027128 [Solea senegalensis]|uniref:Uncharacterized protein n=1 Tax=Solea senegalensis TaxID=28829 RepID=A0AAV6S4L1_SOLSE|nr:hypothetical protein JOB18_027128 [Solea senegalensis]